MEPLADREVSLATASDALALMPGLVGEVDGVLNRLTDADLEQPPPILRTVYSTLVLATNHLVVTAYGRAPGI